MDAVMEKISAFVDAYNGIRTFTEQQRTSRGPLSANGTLRSTVNSLREVVLAEPTAAAGSALNRLSLAGLTHSRDGTLEIDEERLRGLIATDLAGVRSLFSGIGELMSDATEAITQTGDGVVANQTESLQRSIDTLTLRADDIRSRLALQQESLIKQFTRMEEALSRIQAQGSWLASQIQAMQPRDR